MLGISALNLSYAHTIVCLSIRTEKKYEKRSHVAWHGKENNCIKHAKAVGYVRTYLYK